MTARCGPIGLGARTCERMSDTASQSAGDAVIAASSLQACLSRAARWFCHVTQSLSFVTQRSVCCARNEIPPVDRLRRFDARALQIRVAATDAR
jgi:hypothetical protein